MWFPLIINYLLYCRLRTLNQLGEPPLCVLLRPLVSTVPQTEISVFAVFSPRIEVTGNCLSGLHPRWGFIFSAQTLQYYMLGSSSIQSVVFTKVALIKSRNQFLPDHNHTFHSSDSSYATFFSGSWKVEGNGREKANAITITQCRISLSFSFSYHPSKYIALHSLHSVSSK